MNLNSFFFVAMVRNYKRKSTRGNYGEETLKTALQLIHDGRSVRSVSKEFNIQAKTLRRHRDAKVKMPRTLNLGPIRPDLPAYVEAELRKYILDMEKSMYALTPLDVQRLAFLIAEREGMKHNFSTERRMAGKDWLANFIARNKQLSIRVPIGTSLTQYEDFN